MPRRRKARRNRRRAKAPVEEIYDTLEAFKRYGKQVRAEWEREERARMQEVRERATKKEVAR